MHYNHHRDTEAITLYKPIGLLPARYQSLNILIIEELMASEWTHPVLDRRVVWLGRLGKSPKAGSMYTALPHYRKVNCLSVFFELQCVEGKLTREHS